MPRYFDDIVTHHPNEIRRKMRGKMRRRMLAAEYRLQARARILAMCVVGMLDRFILSAGRIYPR